MKKFLIALNSLFPISYNLFKEDYDEIYTNLNKKMKPLWLSSQHSLINGNLPPFIFLATIYVTFLFKAKDWNLPLLFLSLCFFLLTICLVFFMGQMYQTLRWEKYVDEKFLELSKI